uniref:Uncharacterized protein n=1 Tax=Opuntia streptacantha TaxID=393608 RepID=A0A7C9ALY6_OPUST
MLAIFKILIKKESKKKRKQIKGKGILIAYIVNQIINKFPSYDLPETAIPCCLAFNLFQVCTSCCGPPSLNRLQKKLQSQNNNFDNIFFREKNPSYGKMGPILFPFIW